jgi:hypothetical protein
MAAITFDRDGNGTTATLANYFGTGFTTLAPTTSITANDAARIRGEYIIIPAKCIADYNGAAAVGDAALGAGDTSAVSNDIIEFLYGVLRRVEDTYNGVDGAIGTGNTATKTGTKPTNFSISRVETDTKAIFTVALPLSKSTTTAAGSL